MRKVPPRTGAGLPAAPYCGSPPGGLHAATAMAMAIAGSVHVRNPDMLAPIARVEDIAEPLAEQVEADHRGQDRDRRRRDQPRRGRVEDAAVVEHAAPGR